MKTKTFLLTGIAMLLLITSTFAEVTISFEGNDLVAHSDQQGTAGYKGCTADKLQKVSAYTFRLLQRERLAKNAVCKIPSGRWRQIDEQTSDNGSVMFEDLPEGEYKVVCLAGKAIGCEIDGVPDGYPERGIVYAQEVSETIGGSTGYIKKANSNSRLTSVETGLLIFPNPAQDEISVQIKHAEMKKEIVLAIYDMQGKQLFSQDYVLNSESNNPFKVRIENYPSGTYLLRVFDGDGVSVEGKFQVVQD